MKMQECANSSDDPFCHPEKRDVRPPFRTTVNLYLCRWFTGFLLQIEKRNTLEGFVYFILKGSASRRNWFISPWAIGPCFRLHNLTDLQFGAGAAPFGAGEFE